MKKRNYTFDTVRKLQGSIRIDHTLARLGAGKLRTLLENEPYINTLGAYNGQQAVQHAKAGLKAIYLSGWQVAAANNTANTTYPDQSLYPVDSVPRVIKGINNAFRRADQIDFAEGKTDVDYFLPIVADAEAGFGGALNAYELMTHMIEAGAAGVHFEDQLASEKKCGHLGGKVLVPTSQMIRTLNAARLAADVAGVDTVIMARTDAEAATLITSDHDPLDHDLLSAREQKKDFFISRTASTPVSSVGWPMLLMLTFYGLKHPLLIFSRQRNLPRQSTQYTLTRCLHIIVALVLIGGNFYLNQNV
jgi:isocitrate lyase